MEKAIGHFKTTLDIASPFDWHYEKSESHSSLAQIYSDQSRFGDVHKHIKQAKFHSINDAYALGRATDLQARSWYREGRYEEAKVECLCAIEVFGNLGVVKEVERCRNLLRRIEKSMEPSVVITPGGSDLNGEFPKTILLLTPFDSGSPRLESDAQ